MRKRPTTRFIACFCGAEFSTTAIQEASRCLVCARQAEREKGRTLGTDAKLGLLLAQTLQNHAIRHSLPRPESPWRLAIDRDQGAALARSPGYHAPELETRGLGDAHLGHWRLHAPDPSHVRGRLHRRCPSGLGRALHQRQTLHRAA